MDPRARTNVLITMFLIAAACTLGGYYLGLGTAREDETAAKIREVRQLIKEYYFGEPDPAILEHATLDGLCAALDRYCEYYTKEEWRLMETTLSGEFFGVGIQVEKDDDGYLKILAPIENSPAAAANLLPGDKVLEVDGQNIKTWPMDRIVQRIRGKKGEQVTLKIWRGAKEPFAVTLTRSPIKMHPVKSRMADPEAKIGYIRISEFTKQLPQDFDDAFKKLSGEGMRALVVDVRFNPGGLLKECVEFCDRFLAGKKTIVTTEARNKVHRSEETKTDTPETEKIPLAVLINEFSASASEIFAGCMQDYKRGTIVGEKTFGKGLVQQPFELKDGSHLKLTIARYVTPNGRVINRDEKKSIEPDVELKMTSEEYNAVLKAWGQEAIGKPVAAPDKQLDKALELLRSKLNE